jgi:hypothetical protein
MALELRQQLAAAIENGEALGIGVFGETSDQAEDDRRRPAARGIVAGKQQPDAPGAGGAQVTEMRRGQILRVFNDMAGGIDIGNNAIGAPVLPRAEAHEMHDRADARARDVGIRAQVVVRIEQRQRLLALFGWSGQQVMQG